MEVWMHVSQQRAQTNIGLFVIVSSPPEKLV